MNTRRKHPATPDRKSERDGVGRDGVGEGMSGRKSDPKIGGNSLKNDL